MENRFDSLITSLRIKDLAEPKVSKRTPDAFQNKRRFIRGNLRVLDCTEQSTSLAQIEAEWERMRQRGWVADCVILDYDQLIKTPHNREDKRHELDELYIDMVHFARRNRVMVWTAAQTYANADQKRGILTMVDLADHKGKLRHVTLALSIGYAAAIDEKKGTSDWPDEALCLGVAKHRNDVSMKACHVMPDREYMRIYDARKTNAVIDEQRDLPPSESVGNSLPDIDANKEGLSHGLAD